MLSAYIQKKLLKELNVQFIDVSDDPIKLRKLLELTKEIEGVDYPIKYITNQGRAIAVERDDKIIGGYVLITKGDFRTVNGAKHLNPDSLVLKHLDENSLLEIGGVWLEPENRCIKISSCLWWDLYLRVVNSGKSNIIYGYKLERTGLSKMYSNLNPDIIFRGDASGYKNIKTHNALSIETTSLLRFRMGALKMQFSRILRFKKSRGVIKHVGTTVTRLNKKKVG